VWKLVDNSVETENHLQTCPEYKTVCAINMEGICSMSEVPSPFEVCINTEIRPDSQPWWAHTVSSKLILLWLLIAKPHGGRIDIHVAPHDPAQDAVITKDKVELYTYGSEIWPATRKNRKQKFETAEMKFWRSVASYTRQY
jgi:hypothetical protein